MDQSPSKSHLSEIIGGITFFLALGVGVVTWWSGEGWWDIISLSVTFLIAGGLFALVVEGLQTGKLGIRGGDVYRDQNPVMFWGCAVFYVIVGVSFLLGFGIILLAGE